MLPFIPLHFLCTHFWQPATSGKANECFTPMATESTG